MSSAAARTTGGVVGGLLATALIAGCVFWARSMDMTVRSGFSDVRKELQQINARLGSVLEFRGSALAEFRALDAR